MPVVTKDQALARLTKEIQENLGADELLEVYNEVFPHHPYTAEKSHEDTTTLIEQLIDQLNGGLQVDEVVELWGLIFPQYRNVWYDEEADGIHYNEGAEALSTE